MAANPALVVIGREAQRRLMDETKSFISTLESMSPDFVRDTLSAIWTAGSRIGTERGESELGYLRRPIPMPRVDVYSPKKIDALARDAIRNLRDPLRRQFVRLSGEAARDDSFVDGHRKTLSEADVRDLFWVCRMDAVSCLTCRSRHDRKVTAAFPPAHPSCRCLAVSGEETVALSALDRLRLLSGS